MATAGADMEEARGPGRGKEPEAGAGATRLGDGEPATRVEGGGREAEEEVPGAGEADCALFAL